LIIKLTSYKDGKALTGIKQYYKVRAYKLADQSKDSNTISATITDQNCANCAKKFKIKSENQDEIIFTWVKTQKPISKYVLSVAD